MRVRVASFFALVVVFFAVLQSIAQTKPEDQEIKVETDLIEVPFVVTDKTGKPILNLKKSNFLVYEDGKLQELTDFSATSAPLTMSVALLSSGNEKRT